MTLRAFIELFITKRKLFLFVTAFFVFLSIFFYRVQNPGFRTTLFLSVTRSGTESTTDYRYHEFYRLQADERFADTVVRFLDTTDAMRDIGARAGLTPTDSGYFLNHPMKAVRLSSQIVSVTAHVRTPSSGEAIASAIPAAVNLYSAELNKSAGEQDWFEVLGSTGETIDARIPLGTSLLFGLLLGAFFAFWAVLLNYFWNDKQADHESR